MIYYWAPVDVIVLVEFSSSYIVGHLHRIPPTFCCCLLSFWDVGQQKYLLIYNKSLFAIYLVLTALECVIWLEVKSNVNTFFSCIWTCNNFTVVKSHHFCEIHLFLQFYFGKQIECFVVVISKTDKIIYYIVSDNQKKITVIFVIQNCVTYSMC